MAAQLIDRQAILVVARRFPSMGAVDSCSLRYDNYLRMQHFVRRATSFLFGVLGGMCGDNSCNVFLLLFMVLWLPIFATLCMRALLMLWHAFMLLGFRFFPLFFFLLGGLRCFFLQ
jgi:hypothetical protein